MPLEISMTRAAIVGWAHTAFGKLDDPDVESLIARVSGQALQHAGVAAGDVDGIYVGEIGRASWRERVCLAV